MPIFTGAMAATQDVRDNWERAGITVPAAYPWVRYSTRVGRWVCSANAIGRRKVLEYTLRKNVVRFESF